MWRISIFYAAVIVMAWLQTGCFEPAPVYASYRPTNTDDSEQVEDVISRLIVPELYIVEPDSQPAHPHEEEAASAEAKAPGAFESSPEADEETVEQSDEPESERLIGVININTATRAQLELLPRVGTSMSQRIIDYRERRAFTKPVHLRRVKGIGKATYKRFAMHIVVEGETTLRER